MTIHVEIEALTCSEVEFGIFLVHQFLQVNIRCVIFDLIKVYVTILKCANTEIRYRT